MRFRAGTVDLSRLIRWETAGGFPALQDQTLLAQLHREHCAVNLPGDLDPAPDAMHAVIKQQGEWVQE